jgi:hypothetical protein
MNNREQEQIELEEYFAELMKSGTTPAEPLPGKENSNESKFELINAPLNRKRKLESLPVYPEMRSAKRHCLSVVQHNTRNIHFYFNANTRMMRLPFVVDATGEGLGVIEPQINTALRMKAREVRQSQTNRSLRIQYRSNLKTVAFRNSNTRKIEAKVMGRQIPVSTKKHYLSIIQRNQKPSHIYLEAGTPMSTIPIIYKSKAGDKITSRPVFIDTMPPVPPAISAMNLKIQQERLAKQTSQQMQDAYYRDLRLRESQAIQVLETLQKQKNQQQQQQPKK